MGGLKLDSRIIFYDRGDIEKKKNGSDLFYLYNDTTLIFCFFDTSQGDLWDCLWFVPAPDFIKMVNKLNKGKDLALLLTGKGTKVINGSNT
jgi:hypothetical protein